MRTYILVCLSVFCFTVVAQQPVIDWQKTIGGSTNDFANAVHQCKDGGYIVAGNTQSTDSDVVGNHGGYDYFIVRLDSIGNVKWKKTYGGTKDDNVYAVKECRDRCFVLAGTTKSNNGDVSGNHWNGSLQNSDYWIVKLDSIGGIIWQKTLGGNGSDIAYSIDECISGGYIVVGEASSGWTSGDGDIDTSHSPIQSEAWVVKLTDMGGIEWQKSLGGTGIDYAESIKQTNDGGYIIAGTTYSNNGDVIGHNPTNGADGWIVKLNHLGAIEWQNPVGGSSEDYLQSVIQCYDGGYLACGNTSSMDSDISGSHGNWESWVVKISNNGVIEWSKVFGGALEDYAYSVFQTSDSNYIVAATSLSIDGDIIDKKGAMDYWLFKLDESGKMVWQKSFGGSNWDNPNSIEQCSDGNFIIAGYSRSNDKDVLINKGLADYWIVKTKLENTVGLENNNRAEFGFYPNPTTDILFIEANRYTLITIHDLNGKIVQSQDIDKQGQIDISSLSSGMYLLRTKDGFIQKFIKE